MLKIEKNSRQIPSIEKYTANKKYNDLLYGVLQELSYSETENGMIKRYVNKSDISFQIIGDKIGLTRQTTSKRFKDLENEMKLISYDKENQRYNLSALTADISTLIPFNTLRVLNNTLSHNAISIFVYLLKRYVANNEKEYIVTMSQMKKFIGISTATTSNNEVISDILKVLQKLELIKFETKIGEDNKTTIWITHVTNMLKNF